MSQADEQTVPEEALRPGDLPAMSYRDMPAPVPLRKMIGPSVMLAGLALGSGEFVFWPYITYQTKFVFFWACLAGVAIQYFMNMEIARWTLATGESAITGFCRLNRRWAAVFLFMNIVPWIIPAWARGAGDLLSWLIWGPELGGGGEIHAHYSTPLAIAGLWICGAILTAGPVVYETVERIQLFLVGAVLILVVALAVWLVRGDAVAAMLGGAVNVGGLPETYYFASDPDKPPLDYTVLLGALAFAGVGGTLNLGQSNYIKDKGYGMGQYIGRITSPITGQEEAVVELGYHFPHTEENLARWRRWWRAASVEHFFSFFLTCLVCLVLLTLICYSIFYTPEGQPRAGVPEYSNNLGFIWGQASHLRDLAGSLVQTLFLVMGVAILLTTEFGVLDAASRISMDIVKVNWLRDSSRFSESRLYYAFLWGTILAGTAILLVGEQRIGSFGLFKLTAALNGAVMFLYCVTLIVLNRRRLTGPIRMSSPRLGVMLLAVAFFGTFAAIAGYSELAALFGG